MNYNKLPTKEDRAKIILKGHLTPIRNMPKEEIVKNVGAMISICAKIYCGMQEEKMLVETMQEAVRLVYKHYPQIGIEEIREAFSMAAANHFKGVNMTSYFGMFTVAMLGDILTAYNEYRNPIIAEAYKLAYESEKERIEASERKEKNKAARLKIYSEIESAIIAVQEGAEPLWETWHDVPVHYAEIAVQEGWLEVDADFKKQIWEEAKQLAFQELKNTSEDLNNFSEAKKARLALKTKLESQIITEPAKRIYSKLLIFKYVKLHEL